MTYQVLARKWRPKLFEEMVGQEHITKSLQNALRTSKLAHAYLFTGTRGVGKTSMARLFAKAIRCEHPTANFNPCLKCPSCIEVDESNGLDYLEIDGASHNSVENIRELIENVNYLPARGKYKIYVIDEVHMLSVSAFNALLKTLEEPPAHTIFIFATTDAQKLLGTVLSRCQRMDFRHVSVDKLVAHINMIAASEKLSFGSPVLVQKLAEMGQGSIRDTLSLFDQVLSLATDNVISEKVFYQSLGLVEAETITRMLSSVLLGDVKGITTLYHQSLEQNVDLKKLTLELLDSLYQVIQLIDDQPAIYSKKLLTPNALIDISFAEVFWIYETLSKDCKWALETSWADQVVLVCLQKIARRRQFIQPDQAIPQKKTNVIASTPLAEVKRTLDFNLHDYISQIAEEAPTITAYLKRGNLLSFHSESLEHLELTFGFTTHEKSAQEYLADTDVIGKLLKVTSERLKTNLDKTRVHFKVLSEDEQRETGFLSLTSQDEMSRQKISIDKKEKLLNDPMVKEAERLFNSKIDKIILND